MTPPFSKIDPLDKPIARLDQQCRRETRYVFTYISWISAALRCEVSGMMKNARTVPLQASKRVYEHKLEEDKQGYSRNTEADKEPNSIDSPLRDHDRYDKVEADGEKVAESQTPSTR